MTRVAAFAASITFLGCWSSQQSQPAAPAPDQTTTVEPRRVVIKDVVQPVRIEKQEVGGADPGGVPGDVSGPTSSAPPPPPPPPPPAPPRSIAPTLLEDLRIAGDKSIAPNDQTRIELARAGKERIVGAFKLCVTAAGEIASINMLRSTGFTDYDNKIQREMRGWRYRPYLLDGKPVPVCTAITFIYTQKPAPPPPPPPPPPKP